MLPSTTDHPPASASARYVRTTLSIRRRSASKASRSFFLRNDSFADMSSSITRSGLGISESSPYSHSRSSPLAMPYAILDSQYLSITRVRCLSRARRMAGSFSRRFSASRAWRRLRSVPSGRSRHLRIRRPTGVS